MVKRGVGAVGVGEQDLGDLAGRQTERAGADHRGVAGQISVFEVARDLDVKGGNSGLGQRAVGDGSAHRGENQLVRRVLCAGDRVKIPELQN